MKKLAVILLIFGAFCSFAQQFSPVPFIHSHNDYLQERPLLEALVAGAQSIEADVIFQDGELFVAHARNEISEDNTLETLYILPLVKYLSELENEPDFHLMIDIKTEAISTLAAIQKTLEKYPDIFSEDGIQVVISGNRPNPEDYKNYAKFIWFDGREPSDAQNAGGEKVAVISQNLSKFTNWRGEGNIPENDSLQLIKYINDCHRYNKPVRLWNSSDNETMYKFLCSVGVDYVNTDKPKTVSAFLTHYLVGKQLPPWQKGCFDIHHISTGRGNVTFLIYPDGTTMMVDMGDMSETHPRILSPRNTSALPDNSKTPAEWVADYIWQVHPKKKAAELDYALITHYHDDHFGEVDSTLKKHVQGDYLFTGIMELGSYIPVKKLVDRGYSYPVDLKDKNVQKRFGFPADPYSMIGTLTEYWKFINFQKEQNELEYEIFKTGSKSQFKLKNDPEFDFQVQNLFCNGKIVNRFGKTEFEKFRQGEYPGENDLSTGIRISYGEFDYYTGGDISGIDKFGQADINSMESKVAPVIGPVDVAVLNHHGNRDSQNPFYVSTISPRVWVQFVWSSDHPGNNVLRRITSEDLYPGKRDLYSTSMLEANKLVIGDNIERSYTSINGHVVIRVYPGGRNYSVFVLNDKNSEREILRFSNYQSR